MVYTQPAFASEHRNHSSNKYSTDLGKRQYVEEAEEVQDQPRFASYATRILSSYSDRRQSQAALSGSVHGRKSTSDNSTTFSCNSCDADKSFRTKNDLVRHQKTVHSIVEKGDKIFRCTVSGCPSAQKIWTRFDNFKQHVIRMHNIEAGIEDMAEYYDPVRHEVPTRCLPSRKKTKVAQTQVRIIDPCYQVPQGTSIPVLSVKQFATEKVEISLMSHAIWERRVWLIQESSQFRQSWSLGLVTGNVVAMTMDKIYDLCRLIVDLCERVGFSFPEYLDLSRLLSKNRTSACTCRDPGEYNTVLLQQSSSLHFAFIADGHNFAELMSKVHRQVHKHMSAICCEHGKHVAFCAEAPSNSATVSSITHKSRRSALTASRTDMLMCCSELDTAIDGPGDNYIAITLFLSLVLNSFRPLHTSELHAAWCLYHHAIDPCSASCTSNIKDMLGISLPDAIFTKDMHGLVSFANSKMATFLRNSALSGIDISPRLIATLCVLHVRIMDGAEVSWSCRNQCSSAFSEYASGNWQAHHYQMRSCSLRLDDDILQSVRMGANSALSNESDNGAMIDSDEESSDESVNGDLDCSYSPQYMDVTELETII